MKDLKKDHSIGAATGSVGGVMAGAGVGGAIGGPVGAVVGAVVGGIAGAKAGDSIAEAINPTEYSEYWKTRYESQPYYSKQYDWNDYEPAYKLGYETYPSYRGRDLDLVDDELEARWQTMRGNSRLAWGDARQAVRDGWHHIERAVPGDADRDGR
jgi:hypothetical protein